MCFATPREKERASKPHCGKDYTIASCPMIAKAGKSCFGQREDIPDVGKGYLGAGWRRGTSGPGTVEKVSTVS